MQNLYELIRRVLAAKTVFIVIRSKILKINTRVRNRRRISFIKILKNKGIFGFQKKSTMTRKSIY